MRTTNRASVSPHKVHCRTNRQHLLTTPDTWFQTQNEDLQSWIKMQNSLINWALLVFSREGQGFNYFPEGEKVKWPSSEGTPENIWKGQVRTCRKSEQNKRHAWESQTDSGTGLAGQGLQGTYKIQNARFETQSVLVKCSHIVCGGNWSSDAHVDTWICFYVYVCDIFVCTWE